MLVLPQLGFALLGGSDPHAHRLVVGAAGQQRAVLVGPHHPHPLPVARERLHTVTTNADAEDFSVNSSNTVRLGCFIQYLNQTLVHFPPLCLENTVIALGYGQPVQIEPKNLHEILG